MAKKKSAPKKSAAPKKDAAAFVDFVHGNKKVRMKLKKGWDEVIKEGKKQGYKFTKQELHDHMKKKYNVVGLPKEDEPDTCICI
jgi:hypothetical protein